MLLYCKGFIIDISLKLNLIIRKYVVNFENSKRLPFGEIIVVISDKIYTSNYMIYVIAMNWW